MNGHEPQVPKFLADIYTVAWPFLGGLGGSIVSLGLQRNSELPARKKAFNVFAGTIIAVFLGPLAVRYSLGDAVRGDNEMVGAIYCLVGLSATALVERAVDKIISWIDRIPGPRKESGE